jgi:YD repeat-containing protein
MGYDEDGRLSFRRDDDGFAIWLTYDAEGQMSAVDSNGDYNVTLVRDALGRVQSLLDANALDGSCEWIYEYTGAGAAGTLRLYDLSVPALGLRSTFDYFESNQLRLIEHEVNGSNIFSQQFSYRPDRLIAEVIGDGANTFRYDGLKQLVYEPSSDTLTDYDVVGNRLFRAVAAGSSDDVSTATYSEYNQLLTDPQKTATLSYHANGNIRSIADGSGVTEFYFDSANHLRYVRSDKKIVAYTYDWQGRLVERTITRPDQSS